MDLVEILPQILSDTELCSLQLWFRLAVQFRSRSV